MKLNRAVGLFIAIIGIVSMTECVRRAMSRNVMLNSKKGYNGKPPQGIPIDRSAHPGSDEGVAHWRGLNWGPYILGSSYIGVPIIASEADYEDCYYDSLGQLVCQVEDQWYYAS